MLTMERIVLTIIACRPSYIPWNMGATQQAPSPIT